MFLEYLAFFLIIISLVAIVCFHFRINDLEGRRIRSDNANIELNERDIAILEQRLIKQHDYFQRQINLLEDYFKIEIKKSKFIPEHYSKRK